MQKGLPRTCGAALLLVLVKKKPAFQQQSSMATDRVEAKANGKMEKQSVQRSI